MCTAGGDDAPPGPLAEALARAGERPPAITDSGEENRADKKNWAQNFSNALATTIASRLRPKYPKARVTPHLDGSGQEFRIGGKIDRKRTDVGVWDDAAGLVAGVSIKTYTFRDYHGRARGKPSHLGRYTKNVKRNDMELRDEADTLHRRQPYAVLNALFLLPEDACWDGITGHSSFAHDVFTLRKRAGRTGPDGRPDLFERVFIGIFNVETGAVRFFDVTMAPPRNQPPAQTDTVSMDELIDQIVDEITIRNVGVSLHEQYALDAPGWTPPTPLPPGLENEEPLDVSQLIEDDDESAEGDIEDLAD